MLEEDVGPRLADERRRRVEVVVVEHHERVVLALDRADHRLGEVPVHRHVALVPGVRLLLADVGRVREVPQVVLDEPQDRVRDHVVEAVVGVRVGLDQEHLVVDPVELDVDRLPARLALDLGVLLGHRRGDPERLALRDQAGQRGHQAAAAAPHHALAVLVQLELGRAAVRDDYEPLAHARL